jgi:hypothetical protein
VKTGLQEALFKHRTENLSRSPDISVPTEGVPVNNQALGVFPFVRSRTPPEQTPNAW